MLNEIHKIVYLILTNSCYSDYLNIVKNYIVVVNEKLTVFCFTHSIKIAALSNLLQLCWYHTVYIVYGAVQKEAQPKDARSFGLCLNQQH